MPEAILHDAWFATRVSHQLRSLHILDKTLFVSLCTFRPSIWVMDHTASRSLPSVLNFHVYQKITRRYTTLLECKLKTKYLMFHSNISFLVLLQALCIILY
jgi:hypothetical protein